MIYGHADGITGQSFAWRAPDNRSRDNGFISRLHRDESHYVLIRLAAPGNEDRERYPLYGSSSPGDRRIKSYRAISWLIEPTRWRVISFRLGRRTLFVSSRAREKGGGEDRWKFTTKMIVHVISIDHAVSNISSRSILLHFLHFPRARVGRARTSPDE